MLVSLSQDLSALKKDLKLRKDFREIAVLHKNLSKPPHVEVPMPSFTSYDKDKYLKSMANLKGNRFRKFSYSTLIRSVLN